MNWSDERYVRVYTRDTSDLLSVGWEGRLVLYELLRKVDRAGVLDTGGDLDVVPELLRVPPEIVRMGLERLVKRGVVEVGERAILVPQFIEAQESCMSPTARQQESRLRRRDLVRSGLDPNARETVIYCIQSEHGGPVKIGRADDLAKRLVQLQTARPDKLIAIAWAPGTVQDEREIQSRLTPFREKGEWFSPSAEVMAFVGHVAKNRELPRDWSQIVTGHSVPSRAVPSRAEISCEAKPHAKEIAIEILGYLNSKAGSRFTPSTPHVDLVKARLSDGADLELMKRVVDDRCRRWLGDERMRGYLRPKTLFAKSNFWSYADESAASVMSDPVADSLFELAAKGGR